MITDSIGIVYTIYDDSRILSISFSLASVVSAGNDFSVNLFS